MLTYYNDNDPFVCAWLHNLIAAKVIPAGEVDERPIQEVTADDVRGFTQCHFFAGIGGWAYALQLAGWGDRPVWTGSCPCQPFSAAGKRGSHADERHLWPEWFRLLRECGPHVVFGEQVSGAVGLGWLDAVALDLESEGYAVGACVLGAHSVGAPHHRQRLWFVAESNGQRFDGRPAAGRRQTRTQDAGCGGRLADAEVSERRRAGGATDEGRGTSEVGGSGTPFRMADSLPAGRPEGRARTGAGSVASGGESGELGDAESTEREGERTIARGRQSGPANDGILGDPESERCGEAGDTSGRSTERTGDAGAANFWSSCDWLPCRDGKSRPAITSAQLVASGFSPDVAVLCPSGTFPQRAAILRGAGNAIVPPVGAAFVRAYMETL